MAKFETLNSHTVYQCSQNTRTGILLILQCYLIDCSMSFHKLFANGGAWTFLITLSTCKEVGLPILVCFLKHDSAILAISLSHEFGTNRAEGPSPAT